VAGTALGALQFDVIIKLFRQYLGPGADMLEMVSFVLLYMTLCYQIAGLMLGATSEQKRAKAEQAEQPS
jgi:branched-subunit amino acid ABC-type transport system permease component